MKTIAELIKEEIAEMQQNPFFQKSESVIGEYEGLTITLSVFQDDDGDFEDNDAFCQDELNKILGE